MKSLQIIFAATVALCFITEKYVRTNLKSLIFDRKMIRSTNQKALIALLEQALVRQINKKLSFFFRRTMK